MSKSAVPYLYGAEETIPIEQLHPFANHPFHVRHDLEMKELMDSMQMREGDNQRSPSKDRFTRFIRHRMKWHASEYYRKHKPRENVSPLDDVEDQLYDPEVDRWFRYAELVADAERLRAQLTEKENEILALCLKMSRNMAAKELHCSESNINNAIKRINKKARR